MSEWRYGFSVLISGHVNFSDRDIEMRTIHQDLIFF